MDYNYFKIFFIYIDQNALNLQTPQNPQNPIKLSKPIKPQKTPYFFPDNLYVKYKLILFKFGEIIKII